MHYEAKELLEDNVEIVVKDRVGKINAVYDELSSETMYIMACEAAEAKLEGMYVLWLIINDRERADDANDVIYKLVAKYRAAIANEVGYDIENDKQESNSSSGSSASPSSDGSDLFTT